VALLERSLKSRSPEYCDYVGRTSSFVPWPPKAT
jgi:steroid 5-alpha reductase family enzyme